MSDVICVDVVVDVPSSQVDRAYTYRTTSDEPPLGARVRVPFGGRTVSGWVISPPKAIEGGDGQLKSIVAVEDAAQSFGPVAVRLAAWLRRRYACTFREALAAVAPRILAGGERATFSFVKSPPAADRLATMLHRAFGARAFTVIAASRACARARMRMPGAQLSARLAALVRQGVVERSARRGARAAKARAQMQRVFLLDAAAAKGKVQARLAAVLAENGGQLLMADAKRRAGASGDAVRRAQRAGVVRVQSEERGLEAAPASEKAPAFVATAEQRAAIERLDALAKDGGGVALLHGVTGSGKTFVYSRLVDRVRSRGGRAIVLVPEIALTPQTAGRFQALFGSHVGVLHSGLSGGERARVWEDAGAGRIDIVVGARSAVFAPLPDLSLIVVDEEHEPSYKQDVAPRYDAAAVARERMAGGGLVVLGSATPSLESYWEAGCGTIAYVPMRTRATAAPLPPVEIEDMTGQGARSAGSAIGPALLAAMEQTIARGEKVLLFVNRRGYAGLLLCRACGFAPRCKRCAVSLVLHTADHALRCHVCGDAFRAPATCPKCGAPDLLPYGSGTQRVEEEIQFALPGARIVRMDSDTTGTRGAHARLLDQFGGAANVLVGTQMIAKGLDFPTVTLVGVVSADLDLNRPDFRAAERTFALLTQVAGRAGRAMPGSRVIVQTYTPAHYAVRVAAAHDYESFARKELA
ncbi:MAG: primosomal protein N', partial [Candidatus Eremiobacteraeota bacterium]|nr:primosomal protein N' [Candidatus Eremiobacteraeota bacterium]